MRRTALRLLIVLVVVCTALPVGTFTEAKGRCVCPQVYAPVECAKGKVYPNQCVADCRNAKDCVPLDIFAQAASSETPVCEVEKAEETAKPAEEEQKQDIENAAP